MECYKECERVRICPRSIASYKQGSKPSTVCAPTRLSATPWLVNALPRDDSRMVANSETEPKPFPSGARVVLEANLLISQTRSDVPKASDELCGMERLGKVWFPINLCATRLPSRPRWAQLHAATLRTYVTSRRGPRKKSFHYSIKRKALQSPAIPGRGFSLRTCGSYDRGREVS